MKLTSFLGAAAALFVPMSSMAQQADDDLVDKLNNPVAALISVPFQLNRDTGYGLTGDGERLTLNVQPVIPFSLNDNWNIISRTIVPFIEQKDIIPGKTQSGMGDTVQSFFFAPKTPTSGGVSWGVGPVFLLPTGADGLTADQFAAGPTGVFLKRTGSWSYGALANHLWTVGSKNNNPEINTTLFQPLAIYYGPDNWTFSINAEATYDWTSEAASVPVNVAANKLVSFGNQPVNLGVGARYWAETPEGGPDGWGVRLTATFPISR